MHKPEVKIKKILLIFLSIIFVFLLFYLLNNRVSQFDDVYKYYPNFIKINSSITNKNYIELVTDSDTEMVKQYYDITYEKWESALGWHKSSVDIGGDLFVTVYTNIFHRDHFFIHITVMLNEASGLVTVTHLIGEM